MSKKYKWNIPGERFRYISPDGVANVISKLGRNGQAHCGVTYVRDSFGKLTKEVVLSSSNIADITHAVEQGTWDHRHRPLKISKGWTAYIIPNNECRKKHPDMAHGAMFYVTDVPNENVGNKPRWQSEI